MRTVKFRRLVDDIPLNYKFIMILIVGVLLPILVINMLFMDRMADLVRSREKQNMEISLERARKDIHDFIEGGVAVSHALSTDKTLYETLDRRYEGLADFYGTFDEQLRNRVISYIPVNHQILRVGIYTDNPSIVSGGNYHYIDRSVIGSDWYEQWRQSSDPVIVAAYRAADPSNTTLSTPYISVIERMDYYDSFQTYEKLLRIDIDPSKIYDVIVREKNYLNLFLVNERGEIIMSAQSGYQSGEQLEDYPLFKLPGGYAEEEIYSAAIGSAKYVKGWRLIGLPQGTRISSAMQDIWVSVLALAAAVTLTAAVFIYIMLRSYNYRVKRLARHMQKVSNEKFDLIRIDEGRDEIGGLIRNFNAMTTQIRSLINDVYKLEIKQKSLEAERVRAEINFLQSQMNPHFLFNTLNALLVVCTKNQYLDVADIIKSLSKLLRRLLNWKEDIVPLQEEIHFIDMYLKIEKFRFRDKFEYELHIEDEALRCLVPKMSIQPLVENACKHGIQAVDGPGAIRISASSADGWLRVAIEDNGIGMASGKVKEVMRAVRGDDPDGASIGIRNVYRRLELYYGYQVVFDIVSEENAGTTVIFKLPLKPSVPLEVNYGMNKEEGA
ncbi:sensor histidine kinase [Paenibacillus thailandensis]|uniref:Sensor histidine kinase n=1 Tax=Paenibacillus thailandensis TaxID=393250 RepID=A0ABW5QQK3_9BACL